MKIFLIFLISLTVFLVVNGTTFGDFDQKEWHDFKLRFNKNYSSTEEENKRMKIFIKNMRKIAKHNEKFIAGGETFDLGVNEFADRTLNEINQIYNGFNKPNRMKTFRNQRPRLPKLKGIMFRSSGRRPPEYVNWVERGAVTPVRNQGDCGSCYAFSSVAAIESRYFIKKKKLITLSPQNIVDCSRNDENFGCEGGLIVSSYEYAQTRGVSTESAYPYEGEDGHCRYKSNRVAVRVSGIGVIKPYDELELKKAVASGPVSLAINCMTLTFFWYKGGIYNDSECNPNDLNHAVLAVGYGTDPKTKQDYWLVKNSWGQHWGEKGYGRIARNAGNMCGVATRPLFPIV